MQLGGLHAATGKHIENENGPPVAHPCQHVTNGSADVCRQIAEVGSARLGSHGSEAGQRTQFDVSKAAKLLVWLLRPASEVILECASDLIRQHLV